MADQRDSEISVELDVGNLCVSNIVQLKSSSLSFRSDDALKNLAALGVQRLLNEIFKLPSEYREHVPVAKLPPPFINVPRSKSVPKEKPLTKWEKFAKEKGIQKVKKDKKKWDENTKDWKPTYGYNKDNPDDNWLVEVPQSGDPYKDYFAGAREEKKERVAKNEYQRLRNIAKASNMKVTNLESVETADKHQLARSVKAATGATASLGRFTETLPDEKRPKNTMQKRKFKPNTVDMHAERENNLKIFKDIEMKAPKLNVNEAVQRYMQKPMKEGRTEDQKTDAQRRQNSKKNRHYKNVNFRKGKNSNFRGGKGPNSRNSNFKERKSGFKKD